MSVFLDYLKAVRLASKVKSLTKDAMSKLKGIPKLAGSDLEKLFKSITKNSSATMEEVDKKIIELEGETKPVVEAPKPVPQPVPVPVVPTPATPSPAPVEPAPKPVESVKGLPFDPMIAIPFAAVPYPCDKRMSFTIGGEVVQAQTIAKPYSLNVLKHQGWDIVRFECRPRDRRQKSSEVNRDIDRCEIQFERNFTFGKTYRRHWFFMIEPNAKKLTGDNLKLIQDHNVNDPGDSSLGPTFAMQVEGMNMKIVKRTDPNPNTTSRVVDDWQYGNKPLGIELEYGKLYEVELTICYDWSKKGYLKFVINGQTLVDKYTPIGYNDIKGPYAKLGVYRPTDSEVPITIRHFIPSSGFIEDLG